MDRILQNTAATITATFYVDATATDPSPDSATVTITRGDGTAVVTAAAATNAGVGVFSYTLSPAQTASLDDLTVTWTAMISSVVQSITTRVQVVGGFVFSLAEFKAQRDVLAGTYTTADLQAARTQAEEDLEEALGFALVPRYARETLNGSGTSTLLLKQPYVRSLRSVSVDGTAYLTGEVADLTPTPGGVYSANRWTCGFGNVVVEYEHGWDEAPSPIRRAALKLAGDRLVGTPLGDRVRDRLLQEPTAEGGAVNLAVAGMRGSVFGLPEVDAVVHRYSEKMPGVA